MTSFRKYQQITSPYVCSFLTSLMSAALLILKVKKKSKNTCDIYLELRLHSLYGCQGLLNSHLSKKAKRDTIQMAKVTRIAQLLPPIRDRGFNKKWRVYKTRIRSLTTCGPPAFDKHIFKYSSSNQNHFQPGARYTLRLWFSKRLSHGVAYD